VRSRVDRTPLEESVLSEVGERTQVFGLQGFLFFGSIVRLVDTVTQRCADVDDSVEDVVLEFRHVTGVDSGAMVLFGRLVTDLIDDGVHVVVSSASTQVAGMLAELELPLDLASSLDAALARVENRHLAESRATSAAGDAAVPESVPRSLSAVALAAFTRSTVPPNTSLVTEGDSSDVLMYLISGTASVYAGHHEAQRQRIRQFQGPSWMGEIGFLLEAPRSADVLTDTAVEIGSITRTEFEELRRDQPEVVAEVLADIAITLSERTASVSSALVRALD
jgi:SulP family sulfate permease